MLNLRTDFPCKEGIVEQLQNIYAQINDLTREAEQILRNACDTNDVYLTRDQVAEMFHCDPKKIPKGLPKIRFKNSHIIYRKADIDAFLESKTVRIIKD